MIRMTTLAGKVRRQYRDLGLFETLRYSAMRAIDVTQENIFDLAHRVDTAGVTLPIVNGGHGYKGSLPHLVRAILNTVVVPYKDYTFIDLGSGKGRTLLIASEFPFRGIVGIEFDPILNTIAQLNFTRYRTKRRNCRMLESVCGDVRDFDLPPEPLFIYLFNPFEESIIRTILENLERSLQQNPRPVLMVYLRPVFEGAVERAGFLKRVGYRENRLIPNYSYAVYRNLPVDPVGYAVPAT